MFAPKAKTNGQAAAVPAVPSGVQMLLKSLGFDPAVVFGKLEAVAVEAAAVKAHFEALLMGIGQRVDVSAHQSAEMAKAHYAEIRLRLDVLEMQYLANNQLLAEILAEVKLCRPATSKPQQKRK
jgi:hypothetical protein